MSLLRQGGETREWQGTEGFGLHYHLSTERLPDLAEHLPAIIELMDRHAVIQRLLSHLDAIVPRGVITLAVRPVQRGRPS